MNYKILKRNGDLVDFDIEKVAMASSKAFKDVYKDNDENGLKNILNTICNGVLQKLETRGKKEFLVDEISDFIEIEMLKIDYDVARAFIVYRNERNKLRKYGWEMNQLQRDIWTSKYQNGDETFEQWLKRISNNNSKLEKIIRDKKFLFGGRILATRGLKDKACYSNCFVLPAPKDNIESIFDTAKYMARTFSYGGGVGIDISNLRPKGSPVNNAARTTSGATSFMDLYSMVTDIIGQRGRRGALMISMGVDHPDIEEFIHIKNDLNRVTKANISVRMNNEFMEAVRNKNIYCCNFEYKDSHTNFNMGLGKHVIAHDLFMKLAKNNWACAEPGILYWNNITEYNLMSGYSDYVLAGVNPCAEAPLQGGGSCLLGSINLSEFVSQPFTDSAYFNFDSLKDTIEIVVKAMNEVLDENISRVPLEVQSEMAKDWRNIGIGIMGLSDMLIKLGLTYGEDASLVMCNAIARFFLNETVKASALLAKECGPFPKFDLEKTKASDFYKEALSKETKSYVEKYGLRNASLLSIAPTGSISNLLGVSGGIEPNFANSYLRKTQSLHDDDVFYRVFTPIVEKYMNENNIKNEDNLPSMFVTSEQIPYLKRIKMQSVWQNYVDMAISSTINLPEETTVEQVADIYMKAWEYGLKGITVYRSNCSREGVLFEEKKKDTKKEDVKIKKSDEKIEIKEECTS